jgi:hypothetical protein
MNKKTEKLKTLIEIVTKQKLNEISYNEFKSDNSLNYKQKINNCIMEVSKQLKELDTTISRVQRLKTEIGADQTVFLKNSMTKLHKMSETLIKLQNKIREISK